MNRYQYRTPVASWWGEKYVHMGGGRGETESGDGRKLHPKPRLPLISQQRHLARRLPCRLRVRHLELHLRLVHIGHRLSTERVLGRVHQTVHKLAENVGDGAVGGLGLGQRQSAPVCGGQRGRGRLGGEFGTPALRRGELYRRDISRSRHLGAFSG